MRGSGVRILKLREEDDADHSLPVFKAHRLCVSLNSRLESNKEEEVRGWGVRVGSGTSPRLSQQ